jgi:fermentation-respiration switch protein FrsA (DUF1100 family)
VVDVSKISYSRFDRPEILMILFHPRPEWRGSLSDVRGHDVLIPVEKEAVVGARFHLVGKSCPNILFFHGNGEIVADYDDIARLYGHMEINFLPVDYRGYGRSTGRPTITAMMRDCHVIFGYVKNWLSKNGHSGPLIPMGRSLGSACALELSMHHAGEIDGLIIESGFAYVGPLLRLMGLSIEALGISEEEGFRNIEKIRLFHKPTLIIHGERDQIIPFSEGQALYTSCGSSDKSLVQIPGADHNNIFVSGLSKYMEAIKEFVKTLLLNPSLPPPGP